MSFSHNEDEENIEKYTQKHKNTSAENIIFSFLIFIAVSFEIFIFNLATNNIQRGKYSGLFEWWWKLPFFVKLVFLVINILTIIGLGFSANIIK
tara:strand:+ start:100 stop:381 length:282 start_codon:yes stop_codon:yes gene_type:complete